MFDKNICIEIEIVVEVWWVGFKLCEVAWSGYAKNFNCTYE